MTTWGEEGPPEEAYGRVTDANRFAPLHDLARQALDDLAARYAVTRDAWTERDPLGGGTDVPAVRLTPADPAAAPVTVVFTEFPGVRLRYGGTELHLPQCGCDACAETLDECAGQLREQLAAVTAGRCGERLVPRDGQWWHELWHHDAEGLLSAASGVVEGERLAELRAELPTGERRWRPWPVAARGT